MLGVVSINSFSGEVFDPEVNNEFHHTVFIIQRRIKQPVKHVR